MQIHLHTAASGVPIAQVTKLPSYMTPELCLKLTRETMFN